MRVNIYAEEMTNRVEIISKEIDGTTYTGVRFYLYLPATIAGQQYRGPFMHRPGDDDSSAVTFWGKRELKRALLKALDLLERKAPAPPEPAGVQDDGLPSVGGDRLPVTLADFIRACRVHLMEEQEKLNPDNALIDTLCNGVRLARENADLLGRGIAIPDEPRASVAPAVETDDAALVREAADWIDSVIHANARPHDLAARLRLLAQRLGERHCPRCVDTYPHPNDAGFCAKDCPGIPGCAPEGGGE